MTRERRQQVQYLLTRYIENTSSKNEEYLLFKYLDEEADAEEWEQIVEELMAAEEELTDYNKEQWQPVLEQILLQQGPQKKIIRMLVWKWMAAASIMILLGVSAWLVFNKKAGTPPPVAAKEKKDIPAPQNAKAIITLSSGRQVVLDSAGNGLLTIDAGASLVKNANGEIVYSAAPSLNAPTLYNTFFNPRGSKVQTITLSDGTRVWFNSESSLKYPVVFSGSSREVEVSGEVYFEVAHDADKPFKVKNGNTEITVLGTHFNVHAYDDDDALKVTLLEGSIKVSQLAANGQRLTAKIKPGEQAEISADDGQLVTHIAVDLNEIMAWKNGLFQFADVSVETIMKEVGRYYDAKVLYRDKIPGHFVADISRDVPVSKLLQILELTNRVHFEVKGNTITVMK